MKEKYIVGIITKQEKKDCIKSKIVNTIEEADNYALEVAVTWGLTKGYVKNRDTKENVKFYSKEDFE